MVTENGHGSTTDFDKLLTGQGQAELPDDGEAIQAFSPTTRPWC